MKAILISRPGDFGVLEEHWTQDAVLLPLSGGTVLDLHEAVFLSLGITEARLLRCHGPAERPHLAALEDSLKGRPVAWSVRGWPLGPYPRGWSLSQALLRQALYLDGAPAYVAWVPVADPRPWTGPQVPSGFPAAEVPGLRPSLWHSDGRLVPAEGPFVSLGGSRDFYRASLRFLEVLPPAPLGLHGIHRRATLEPPLLLGRRVHAAANSRLGPLVQLAEGSQLRSGTSLTRTLVLTPTSFPKDWALADKIVIGAHVVEPFKGDVVPL